MSNYNKPDQSTTTPQPPQPSTSTSQPLDENVEKWGTHVMGAPAIPSSHPNNQKAASQWSGQDHHPYVQYTPVQKPPKSPMESAVNVFNSWTNKAETLANNIWHNLKTGPSASEAAWAKVGIQAKALTGEGLNHYISRHSIQHPMRNLRSRLLVTCLPQLDQLRVLFTCQMFILPSVVTGHLHSLHLQVSKLGATTR
ncbi:hypothetical protein MKW92_033752 [Papaver armeniacum]|nr:hypothetical protein MKW92_033752 [Papaver armeniacum]